MNAAPPTGTPATEAEYRRRVNAWAMYDWANSAFATVIMAAVFPVFYRSLAREGGLHNEDATAAWSYTNSAAMLLVALAGPVLGAMADAARRKKLFIAAFAALGIVGSAGMVGLADDVWLAARCCSWSESSALREPMSSMNRSCRMWLTGRI